MGAIKLASIFFLGNLLFGSLSFLTALLLRNTENPISSSIIISMAALGAILVYLKRRKTLDIEMSPIKIFLVLILSLFAFYIMQKSFSYSDGFFEIASNQYFDFGTHVPIIRSFSLGDNVPPIFPYYAGSPNTYYFMFDYLVSLYEKLGLRIDYALNFLSAGAFVFVCLLIYYIAYELFNKGKLVAILSVLFFIFNSSLSFIDAIKRYGLSPKIVWDVYHHNVYLGDGPSGDSIVSIFWSLNTYLNQRPFLFGIGIGLLTVYFLLRIDKFTKKTLLLLSLVIGVLPLWHITIFISLLGILSMHALLNKSFRYKFLLIIALSILIALPQLIYLIVFSNNHVIFQPGFLISNDLSVKSFVNYWFNNLGFSLLAIILGFLFSNKKQKLFFLGIAPLFVLPNLFQFGGLMFDNHKFLNVFIIFANMYSAYLIYLVLRRKALFKILGASLIILMTISGVIDFFVIKNDVKTRIADYPSSKFQSFILENTSRNSVFLSNKTIYDPVNFVGRQSYLGESHYLFTYGINPDKRIKKRSLLFSINNANEILRLLKDEKISYVAIYKDEKIPDNQKLYEENFKKAYGDQEVTLLKN